MEKVKITVENKDGKKSEMEIKINNDNTMDVGIEFTPEVKKDEKGFYIGVTNAILKMMTE